MTWENVGRVAGLLAEEGLDWLVLSSFDGVCFATGHVAGIETGPSPFSGGPTLALVGRDASHGIVASNVEGIQSEGAAYEIYEGFSLAVTDQTGNYLAALDRLLARLGVSGRIGVEASLPAIVAERLPGGSRRIGPALDRLRAVKTGAEIARLTRCGEVAAAGQERARKASSPGATEAGVLNEIRARMETLADARCALAGEYMAGSDRTARLGLPVSAHPVSAGDPVICDLAPRVAGYWGDSCGAFVVGDRAPEPYLAMWRAARDALALAEAELRPGLRVSDFDRTIRDFMAGRGRSYPHHTGHGIGASVHEWPRLVPGEDALIERDMVLMVEPGCYEPGIGGVRCEFMLRVTAAGCENLTPFTMEPVLA
jgi:Xaa-Pro aminopeptidase